MDTTTLESTIGSMSDDDLLKRWHFGMFSDEALPIAEAEAAKRKLTLDGTKVERAIALEATADQRRRTERFKNILAAIVAGVGALNLGILGGLAYLAIGGWAASIVNTRARSSLVLFSAAVGVVAIAFATSVVLKLALRSILTPATGSP